MTHQNHLAVFDWNSTLLDDMGATTQATNACLEFFDIAPLSALELQEIFTFPLIHFYEKAGVKVGDYLANANELGDIFHNKYNALKQECTLMDGTVELLDWLKSKNIRCKILSNYSQQELENDVRRLGVAHYFETISGNADPATIISGTNKLERLQAYLSQHGISPQNTFIIGDSHEEPELARKLDILGISIAGGLLSPTRLEHYKKDYVIIHLKEMKPILQSEWGV